MNYNLNKKDNGSFEATITVEKEEWEKALTNAYEKNKSRFNIPGFRNGHAPRNVIEKQYGKTIFVNEALDATFYMAYTQILKEHEDIKPVVAPKLDIKKVDDTGVEMVMTLTCMPEFELAQYKGLTFTRQAVEVTDKDVEEAIKRDLLRGSRLVETKEAVKVGDYVTLDFDGYIDGKQFDGGKAENYQLQIGSHSFIDTFEDQLVGLNIGDKKDVVVTFPADYHVAELAGKPATFKVEIKNIRSRIMPELNEEFVSNSTEFETVDEYKADVKARLTKQAEEHADLELENDMLDKVIDDTDFTAPDSLVEEEYDRQIKGMENQMKYQGITMEGYCKYIGKTMEEFTVGIRQSAARNVKGRIVLEKLVRDNNIDITEQDINAKLQEMAKNVGKTLEEFKKEANNDMLNRVANELLMRKLINFLRENNEIK